MHNIVTIKNSNTMKNILLKYYNEKYGISTFENIHNILNTDIIHETEKEFYKNKIPLFGKTDRNSCFVKFFYKIFDRDYNILIAYINFIINEIKPLFPNEKYLIIQKTPNIRFHLPGFSNIGRRLDCKDENEFIGVHYDGEFGHPKEEINVVLPITKMYETNSIYFENEPNKNIEYKNYNNLKLDENEFYMGNLNQCKHYNKINKTNITRVSFDFRIIPYSKFKKSTELSATGKINFEIGKYYMLI
tara:strand:+ start:1134 stop:1871 length:738 start_codon:yes stop_codon:yes gene_type:complete